MVTQEVPAVRTDTPLPSIDELMKRILVGSIQQARGYRPAPGERYAVISFVDVTAPTPSLKRYHGCVGRLVVRADDVLRDHEDDCVGLVHGDALRVALFCLKWKDAIDTLVVHCRMGMSRSPGAAEAIAEVLGIEDVEFLNQNVIANRHVREAIIGAIRHVSGNLRNQ